MACAASTTFFDGITGLGRIDWIRAKFERLQRGEQFGHVVADFAKDFGARFLCGGGDAADDGRADDQAVGHGGEQLDVFGLADAEADADRQVGLRRGASRRCRRAPAAAAVRSPVMPATET